MGYVGCPVGCGPVAVAKILAFHQLPKSYCGKSSQKTHKHIVERVPELKNWDGVYNWKEILKREKIENLSNEGRLQLGVLLYNIGEIGNASYSTGATGMNDSGAKRCFEYFGFKYGDFSSYSSYGYISPMKRKGRIGRIGSGDRETRRKPIIKARGYNFAGVKVSIDNNAPVLVLGFATKKVEKKSAWWWAWEWEEISYNNGHGWVIDGYCRLFCRAKNRHTGETKNIVANYVHCNVGWGGINNGYYIDGIFTFNKATANAEDHQIRSTYGTYNYYKYNITMFHNIVPK